MSSASFRTTRLFAQRPAVYEAWQQLRDAIAGEMDPRRYELATLAAARELGLSDREIFDVVLAAAAQCFFSKAVDAVGVLPDAEYAELEPGLREALTVGRPIANS